MYIQYIHLVYIRIMCTYGIMWSSHYGIMNMVIYMVIFPGIHNIVLYIYT